MLIRYDSEETPLLSVCVVTYNQEEYIAQAVESALMQKTQYPFELLIVDDCSTDGTRGILKKFKEEHDEIGLMLLEENTFRTAKNAYVRVQERARGKYINVLEGDDYWIDPEKLEKQLRFLADHPDYVAVYTKCVCVGKDSQRIDHVYPDCPEEDYQMKYWYNWMPPGQTATRMSVNPSYRPDIDWSLTKKGLEPGDLLRAYVLALHGKIRCLQEVTSAYRYVTDSGGSYSANITYSYEKTTDWNENYLQYTYEHGSDHDIQVAELRYLIGQVQAFKHGKLTLKEALKLKYCKAGKWKLYRLFALWLFRYYVLHKEISID
ncbi:MAG: glycosyltransferase family 2 protein [Eubacterium sp.]|nr:glycosyltransferase family 2 protein [Eubacterium sp.]